MTYKPFANEKICIQYGFLAIMFEYTMILLSLIKYSDIVHEYKFFYT